MSLLALAPARLPRAALHRFLLAGSLIALCPRHAHAQDEPLPAAPPEPSPVSVEREGLGEQARDTSRLSLGLGGAMFASFPGSYEDPGPLVHLAKPLWYGHRYRFFQWELQGDLVTGYGTRSRSMHLWPGSSFGFHLYLGSVFGFEFRTGLAVPVQVGRRTVAGLGLAGGGGYVFRFWKDDRRRLKLQMTMNVGGYFASDPGNDLGTTAAALGLGLGYEMPLLSSRGGMYPEIPDSTWSSSCPPAPARCDPPGGVASLEKGRANRRRGVCALDATLFLTDKAAFMRLACLLSLLPFVACAASTPPPPPPAAPVVSASAPPAPVASPEPAPAVSSVASAPPAAVPPEGEAPPLDPRARRYRYHGFRIRPDVATRLPLSLTLVEVSRRTVARAEVMVLATEIEGKRADGERLREMGVDSAPFTSLPARWVVVRETGGAAPGVWLLEGEGSDEEVKKARQERPSLRLSATTPMLDSLKNPPMDRHYTYRRKVGAWMSHCEAFVHPSPDSGDFYSSERCYAADAGLTRLDFSSVWGGYELELVEVPR